MTPDEYRHHSQRSLARAFFRGELAGSAGVELSANPYREVHITKKARRGSWSEAFSRAWAVGWRNADRTRAPAELAASSADEGAGS